MTILEEFKLQEVRTTEPDRMRKVAEVIKANPEHFDMNYWVSTSSKLATYVNEMPEEMSCGTTACIAGWAVHLFKEQTTKSIPQSAIAILGLTVSHANLLFLDPSTASSDQAYEFLMAIADVSEEEMWNG